MLLLEFQKMKLSHTLPKNSTSAEQNTTSLVSETGSQLLQKNQHSHSMNNLYDYMVINIFKMLLLHQNKSSKYGLLLEEIRCVTSVTRSLPSLIYSSDQKKHGLVITVCDQKNKHGLVITVCDLKNKQGLVITVCDQKNQQSLVNMICEIRLGENDL